MKTEKTMKRVYTGMMAAVMFSAATLSFSACSSVAEEMLLPEVPEQTAANHTYTLSVNASKGEDGTRALDIDDNTNNIIATWTVGDVVKVYNASNEIGELTAQTSGANTTLTGELYEGVTLHSGDALTLKYLSDDYSNQEGTLEYIASHCDYATATVTVSSVPDDGKITTTDAAFVNQQAIVRFMLKDQDGTTINPTLFSVKYGDKSIEIKDISQSTYTTNGAGVLYVAIPGGQSKDVILKANEGSTVYTFMRHSVAFTNANYYPINVRMKWDEHENPLTFEAKEAGATVVLTIGKNIPDKINLEYKIKNNNAGETDWTGLECTPGSQPTLPVELGIGDKVMFRGENTRLANQNGITNATVFTPMNCYVYGNVMSLLYKDNFSKKNSFPEGSKYTFANLFRDANLMYNHPYKTLVLPATTLTNYCYTGMFYNCMNLTKAPGLPATTLAEGCYKSMFQGCTSLTTAPDLLAETGVLNCYQSMFYGCSNLTSVRCYINPNGKNTYTSTWLSGVASSGTFYAKSEKNWNLYPTSGIPSGWTRVDE